MKSFKVKFLHAYRGHIYVLYIPAIRWSNLLYMRTGPKFEKNGQNLTFKRPPVTLKLKAAMAA